VTVRYVVILVAVGVACSSGSGDKTTSWVMQGASMEPTFSNGTPVTAHSYDHSVQIGDIIVFRAPLSVNRESIKRVIAGPGQTVVVDGPNHAVAVDGIRINEPYTEGKTECFQSGPGTCKFAVPSTDSGVASIPGDGSSPVDPTALDEACRRSSCYFVMGDNRQNSSDSRAGWLVPTDNIIGHVDSPGTQPPKP
jgi:signal peptidase I